MTIVALVSRVAAAVLAGDMHRLDSGYWPPVTRDQWQMIFYWAINNELTCEKDLIESRWLVIVLVKKTEKEMQYWAVIEILFTKFT